jgi:ABC-type lipoprotein release transport system permease subunit
LALAAAVLLLLTLIASLLPGRRAATVDLAQTLRAE